MPLGRLSRGPVGMGGKETTWMPQWISRDPADSRDRWLEASQISPLLVGFDIAVNAIAVTRPRSQNVEKQDQGPNQQNVEKRAFGPNQHKLRQWSRRCSTRSRPAR